MYEGPALRCPNLNQIILLNDLEREYDLKDHKYIWTLNDEEVLNLHFAGTYIRNI